MLRLENLYKKYDKNIINDSIVNFYISSNHNILKSLYNLL